MSYLKLLKLIFVSEALSIYIRDLFYVKPDAISCAMFKETITGSYGANRQHAGHGTLKDPFVIYIPNVHGSHHTSFNVIKHYFDRDWIRKGDTLLKLFSSAYKNTMFSDI